MDRTVLIGTTAKSWKKKVLADNNFKKYKRITGLSLKALK